MRIDEWTIDMGATDRGSSQRLAKMLNQPFAGLTGRGGEGPWVLSPNEDRIGCSLTIEAGREQFCVKTGNALAEYLVSEKEPSLLRAVMSKRFGLRSDSIETDVLISEAIVLLDGEPETEADTGRGRNRRIRKWGRTFAAYLKDNSYIHLDGFIRFRLKDYFAEVREAAETALEERAMERQYQEFVKLLQSMVEWQEVRLPAVHLLHSGGHAFQLYDEQMRPLEREEEEPNASPAPVEGVNADEQEESMLVSRLLAASPRHLYIYTPEPDAQVIRTLLGIFGERAAICPKMPT